MKIRYSALILFIVLAFTTAKAALVEKETARTVAKNYILERIHQNQINWEAGSLAITDVLTYSVDGKAAYYVFSNKGRGFVIVSAEDQLTPVLGYSPDGIYPEIGAASNFDFFVHSYAKQVQWVRNNAAEVNPSISQAWNTYISGNINDAPAGTTDVEPLLMSIWDQVFPYNAYCPEDEDGPGGHALTGCVATAMSQIMLYYRYPLQGNGSKSYYDPDYGTLAANFGATYYDWDMMLNELTSGSGQSIPAVATLNFHAGVSVSMNYGPDASGAYSNTVPGALKNNFRYASSTTYQEKGGMTQTQWENQFTPNLDEKKPVYMSGQGADGGHAWVVDGYQVGGTSKMFHMNFGWGGYQNGYYTLASPNGFPSSQACVKNIYPGTGYPYGCSDKTLTAAQGSFEDGGPSNGNYSPNLNCSWLLAPADSVTTITLTFNSFNVGSGDTLYVYDGSDVNAPMVAAYNGNEIPAAITSTGNTLFLVFKTDATIEASGWQAEYHPDFPNYCSGTDLLEEPLGSLSDGSGSKTYNNNSNCVWKIKPPYAMNLTLNFTAFDLAEGDKLKVISTGGTGGNQLMGTFTGTTIPDPIVCTGTGFMLVFTSDAYDFGQGFEANYTIGNVSVNDPEGISNITIAPNPASKSTTVRFFSKDVESFRMNIIDMAGKQLYHESFAGVSGNFVKAIDLTDFNKGMYFLTIQSKAGTTTRKFIVK